MSAYDWDSHELQHGQQQRFTTTGTIESPPSEAKGGKRSRQTYSKYQTAVLETVFRTSKYIVRSKRQQMSAELNLTERQIKIWFQNRRMKEKKCHRDVVPPRGIDHGAGLPANVEVVTGYGDGYAVDPAGGYQPTNNNLRDDAFAGYRGPAASCKLPDDDGCYGGYAATGGYDSLTPEPADPYAKQQWPATPVTTVIDFHQDHYGDLDMGNFQGLPMTHHHHHHHRRPLNAQVHDYCSPPQLQAAHGY